MSEIPKSFEDQDSYKKALESLQSVIVAVLYNLAPYSMDTKHLILRNTLARTSMSLKAIFMLWDMSDFQDAWTVHRTLIDRLFHITDLGKQNSYEAFDDWSFFELYKAQNKVKSDSLFKHEATGPLYKLSTTDIERARKLSASPPEWKRPRAKDVAKSMELAFLYSYGYDFASKYVHPMSNDGEQDFYTVTKLEPAPTFPDQIEIRPNSILAASLLVHEALNQSSFGWRTIIFDYIEELGEFLKSGNESYIGRFESVMLLAAEQSLCKPSTKESK